MKTLFSLCSVAAIFVAAPVSAQNYPANQLANLSQDVAILSERLNAIQLEIESLRRENALLRQTVKDSEGRVEGNLGKLVTSAYVNEVVNKKSKELEQRDLTMRNEILLEVTKQLQQFANKVGGVVGSGGSNTPPRPDPDVITVFNSDFPKTGINYVVRSGDTLSSIAEKNNSRVDWIQHANKIASPRLLQVGQTLFIPQQAN